MTNVFKLCERGRELYEYYCALAEHYEPENQLCRDAWDEWILHKRGTAQAMGCETCSGLKPRIKNAAQSREG